MASAVEELLNLSIGLPIGGIDFSCLSIVLSGERRSSLQATRRR